jgi:hypothetical protein
MSKGGVNAITMWKAECDHPPIGYFANNQALMAKKHQIRKKLEKSPLLRSGIV